MIRYRDIEDLPANHPMVAAFLAQDAELEAALVTAGPMGIGEEGESDHFERYVAGDR